MSKLPASQAQKKQFQAGRTQFRDISLTELSQYEQMFLRFDTSGDGFLTDQELKYGLEKMNCPQTHMQLKALIKEIDLDLDGKVSYVEFLMIFKKAKDGTLISDGLKAIAASINVDQAGVKGAKGFFEQKAKAINNDSTAIDAAYFAERKAAAQKKAASKAAFKEKASLWK